MGILDTVVSAASVASSLFGGGSGGGSSRSGGTATGDQQQVGFNSIDELIRSLQAQSTARTGNTQSTAETSQDTTSTGTSDTSTSESRTGSTTGTQGTESAGTETTTSRNLDEELVGGLNTLLSLIIGGGTGGALQSGQQAINERIGSIQDRDFDVDSFVQGITNRADNRARFGLESGIQSLESRAGGSEGSNSAVALLANRLRDDTASNLAGIEADARARGEEIRGQNSAELSQLAQSGAGGTLGLIQALMGAEQTSEATSALDQNVTTNRSETQETEGSIAESTSGTQSQTGTSESDTTETAQSNTNTIGQQAGFTDTLTGQDTTSSTKRNSFDDGSGDDGGLFGSFSRIAQILGQSASAA